MQRHSTEYSIGSIELSGPGLKFGATPAKQNTLHQPPGTGQDHPLQSIGNRSVHGVTHHWQPERLRSIEGVLDDLAQVLDPTQRPRGHEDHQRRPPSSSIHQTKRQGQKPQREETARVTDIALRYRCLYQPFAKTHRRQESHSSIVELVPLAVCEETTIIGNARRFAEQQMNHTARWAVGRADCNLILRREEPSKCQLVLRLPPTARHVPRKAHGEGREQPAYA
mmetsp:Transcript_24341/g.54220  ORF Transcript_24341/g.54220 Transcript_24341/m.54220 type:complete len:224 (+) Transcript_24341:396-1067(+)